MSVRQGDTEAAAGKRLTRHICAGALFPSAQKACWPEQLAAASPDHFPAVQFQAIGLLCTKRLEAWRRRWVRSGLPAQQAVLVYTMQWHQAPEGLQGLWMDGLSLAQRGHTRSQYLLVKVPAALVCQFGSSPVVARPFRQGGGSVSEQKIILTYH